MSGERTHTPGPWIAPTVGYVDHLGNLRCAPCASAVEMDAPKHVLAEVSGDQWFGPDDTCCRCGKQLEHVPTSGYVQTAALASANP